MAIGAVVALGEDVGTVTGAGGSVRVVVAVGGNGAGAGEGSGVFDAAGGRGEGRDDGGAAGPDGLVTQAVVSRPARRTARRLGRFPTGWLALLMVGLSSQFPAEKPAQEEPSRPLHPVDVRAGFGPRDMRRDAAEERVACLEW
jgi:hypothetical protein